MSTPTPAQAKVLRAAAQHTDGLLVGAGTVLRRNLRALGWVEPQERVLRLPNRQRGTTTEVRTTVYVITDAGRSAIGDPPSTPPPTDLDHLAPEAPHHA